MESRIATLEEEAKNRKQQQISYPIDDASRKTIGMGVMTPVDSSITTPAGAVTVDTNVGPLKVLVA